VPTMPPSRALRSNIVLVIGRFSPNLSEAASGAPRTGQTDVWQPALI
jgi:hypothetical protein